MGKLRISRVDGKRTAVYLRRSTDAQEASIEGQRSAAYQYAERHGYEIVSEFVDSGITGVDSSAVRTQFQKLTLAAERGEFEYVLAWDLSRITRSDPMETMAELRPLKRAGIKLVTTDKNEPIDWSTFAGMLMMAVEAESNNQYVRRLARGTTRGQADIARTGRWVAGRPPLGYVVNADKRLILGPQEAVDGVNWAFNAYAAGQSLRAIREGLANRGCNVVLSSVSAMLRNRLYCGDFVWGRITQAKFYSVRDGQVSDDFERGGTNEADQIIIENNHPAIVDRALFDRVQKMFEQRKRASTPVRGGGGYVLTSLLRCAHCGYRMIGFAYKTNTAEKHRFRCGGSQTKGVNFCNPRCVNQEEILDLVFATFQDRFANPENVEKIKQEAKRQLETMARDTNPKQLEKELAKEQKKLDQAGRRLVEVDADLLDVVQGQIREIKKRIESLERDIKRASLTSRDVFGEIEERAERAAKLFEKFSEAYKGADPAAIRAFLLETIDHIRVDVSRSKVNGRWRYKLEGGDVMLKQNADLFDSW